MMVINEVNGQEKNTQYQDSEKTQETMFKRSQTSQKEHEAEEEQNRETVKTEDTEVFNEESPQYSNNLSISGLEAILL